MPVLNLRNRLKSAVLGQFVPFLAQNQGFGFSPKLAWLSPNRTGRLAK
jgi:hypothetical protein